MAERWVVNASPLIVMAKIGHAQLLSALADEIVVPQTVVDEINAVLPTILRGHGCPLVPCQL